MERYVRIGHTLNDAERRHVTGRRQIVSQCLRRNGIPCTPDNIPNIAVIGSGGGERAMVGLLGCLLQLGEADLLDCIMYLSGVSGSTWGMASLYKYPNWTKKEALKDETQKIAKRLSYDRVSWSDGWKKYRKYYNQWDKSSLTEFWAAEVVTTYVKEIDEHVLSEQRGKFDRDPYPIFTIIDKEFKKRNDGLLKNAWVEMTPHEAGYSLTGAFVDQKYFASKFDSGSFQEKQPEMDMLYVQGICGSAGAVVSSSLSRPALPSPRELWSILKKVADIEFEEDCWVCEVLHTLIELNLLAAGGQDYSHVADKMNTLLKGKMDMTGAPFIIVTQGAQEETLKDYTLSVCDCFSDWLMGCKVDAENWTVMTATIKSIWTGSWGDTYNFLHNMKKEQVPEVDSKIVESEVRNYIDAGLLLNSPYFSVLRKERKVDLIISLDFSDGDAMMTIEDAHKMSGQMGIAFPKVSFPDNARNAPEDFYVFPGDGNYPTVIHMPLFNLKNCGSADEIKHWRRRFTTFQLSLDRTQVTDLLAKAGENVINNKKRLLDEIRKVAGSR